MTSTSVVLGIAALGTPGAPPDCDWATDDAGITEFIGLSFLDPVWFVQSKKSTDRALLSWYHWVPLISCNGTIWHQVVKERMMARASMPKHRQEGGETAVRERILEAALAAFMKSGYAATSTLEIATRARVSKRELYAFVG